VATNVHANAVQLLRARHEAKFDGSGGLRPGFAVKYPNSPDFVQPDNAPWSDWRPMWAHATQLTANAAGGERRIGTLIEDINVPRLNGELLPAQIGDDICVVWRPDTPDLPYVIPSGAGYRFRFFPTTVTEVGIARDDNAWFRCTAVTPLWYDYVPS
jgi:hypothetical protein